MAGGAAPSIKLYAYINDKKIVVTLHGAAPFVLPRKLYYDSTISLLKGEKGKLISYMKWLIYRNKINRIITVSKYAREEIVGVFRFDPNKVIPIYHGVDTNIYNSQKSRMGCGEYLLHISQYQPKKNIDKIVESYKLLDRSKPKLILIVPGYNKKITDKSVELINFPKKTKELSYYYKNALAFIFPSLHETFGMPILEAMACGCPVITSNTSACAEIAGDAALLVNPYSVEEISEAMQRLIVDSQLRKVLSRRGIERAKQFTWKESAMKHLKVFEEVLKEDK